MHKAFLAVALALSLGACSTVNDFLGDVGDTVDVGLGFVYDELAEANKTLTDPDASEIQKALACKLLQKHVNELAERGAETLLNVDRVCVVE